MKRYSLHKYIERCRALPSIVLPSKVMRITPAFDPSLVIVPVLYATEIDTSCKEGFARLQFRQFGMWTLIPLKDIIRVRVG